MEPCILIVPFLIAEVLGHYMLGPVILIRQDLRWWPTRFSIGDGVVLAVYLQIAVAVFAAVAPEKDQSGLWGIGLIVVLLATGALWSFAMANAEQRNLQPRKKVWLTLVLLPLTGVAMIAGVAAVIYIIFLFAEVATRGVSAIELGMGFLAALALFPGPLLVRRLAAWVVQSKCSAVTPRSVHEAA